MRERPKIIVFLAACLLLAPFVAGPVIYYLNAGYEFILPKKLLITFALFAFVCAIAAFGIWRVRAWGYYLFLGVCGIVLAADLLHIVKDPRTLNVWDFVDLTMVALGVFLLSRRSTRAPYFDPKLRWWERAFRVDTALKGTFVIQGNHFSTIVTNISASGCFIETREKFTEGTQIFVSVDTSKLKVGTKAKVTRCSPKGMGLMFIEVGEEQIHALNGFVEEMKVRSA